MLRFLVIFCFALPSLAQISEVAELNFKNIHVLTNYPHEFDLSGIVKTDDKCYVINDKRWSKYAYEFQAEDGIRDHA